MRDNKVEIPFYKPDIRVQEINAVTRVLKSGWITMGPVTAKFEREFAKYIGCREAVALSSCTAGLHLSLLALGIKPGDEVITTPFTFCSTVNVIVQVGAVPLFVDIKREDLNIDERKIREKITKKTKAIIPVHYGGYPCEMDEILRLADDYQLHIVEDAAHATGSEYKSRKIGNTGTVTCFSFYATKNLTTGEGGMVTTSNVELADRIRCLRLHGMNRDAWKRYANKGHWYYEILELGWKYNMSDIQAALGIAQLKRLGKLNLRRRQLTEYYNERLSSVKGLLTIKESPHVKSSCHLYPVLVEASQFGMDRNQLIERLAQNRIGTSVHFIPVYRHPFYQRNFKFSPKDFPNTEWAFHREVSLPLYPTMNKRQIEYIVDKILSK